MEVKPGYKQTEVGIIPEDWEVTTFGQICHVNQGLQIAIEKRQKYQTSKSKIYITIQYLNDNKQIEYIDDYPASAICHRDDVLMTRTGNTGVVVSGVEGVFHNNFFKINFNNNVLIREFLIDFLNLENTHKVMLVKAGTSTIPDLNHGDFYSISLPIPPIPEQRAIAAALSDIDALLDGLDRLIAKKRDLKQAAMQQLLTGQTRLPGFSGEWETRKLGNFVSIRNQKIFPSQVNPDTPCVELEHIGQGNGKVCIFSTAQYSTSSKYRFFAGDILFGRLRSYLRKYWHADRDGICSTEIWPLLVDDTQAVSGFLHALVQLDRFIEAASISYGTHMPRADWDVIKNFDVRLPLHEEQTAIAAVLSDMDAEIAALEARCDKTRALKQGMMQELLTGRIRLVDPSIPKLSEGESDASTATGH